MSGQTNGFDVRGLLERTDARMARKNGDDPLPPATIDAFAQAVEAQLPKLNASANGNGSASATVVAALERDVADAKALAESLRSMRDRAVERVQEVQIDLAAARQEIEQLRRDGGRAVEIVGETDARVTALQDQLDAQQTELEKLGREHGKSLQENLQLTERVDAQRDEIDAINTERDQLREQLAKALKAGRPRHTAAPVHEHRYPQAAPDELPGPCEGRLADGTTCGKPFPRALFDDPDDDEVAGHTLSGWDEQWEQIRAELQEIGWPDNAADPQLGATHRDGSPEAARGGAAPDGRQQPGELDPVAPPVEVPAGRRATDGRPAGQSNPASDFGEFFEPGNRVSTEPVEREAKRSTPDPARRRGRREAAAPGASRHLRPGADRRRRRGGRLMRIPSRRPQTKATLDLLRNRTTRGTEYVLATIEQESPRQVLAVEVDLAPVMDALGLVPPSPPGHILEVGPYRFERDGNWLTISGGGFSKDGPFATYSIELTSEQLGALAAWAADHAEAERRTTVPQQASLFDAEVAS